MKQFKIQIIGTYITKVFECVDIKDATTLGRQWLKSIKNCDFKRIKVIEL